MSEPAPRPSSHAWCPLCRTIRPYRCEPLHPASRQRSAAFDGELLRCGHCTTAIATVYAAADLEPHPKQEGHAHA